MKHNMSQAWSIDFIIAISIFIVSLVVFYSLLNPAPTEKPRILEKEASIVAGHTEEQSSPLAFVEGNAVNETKLTALIEQYPKIKKELGVQNDFCIYFEDENGNVIPLREDVAGIGSTDISIGSIKCG